MKKTTNKETQGQNQNKVSRDEVAQRACELWEAAGRPVGRDEEYWLQAEAELLASRRSVRSPVTGASQASAKRKAGRTMASASP